MHITRVDIEGVPPVEDITLYCDEHVNLFIGPNASGKSTILRAINGLNSSLVEPGTPEFLVIAKSIHNARLDEDVFSGLFLWVSDGWTRDAHSELKPDALPVLYIPAVRVGLRGQDIWGQTIGEAADLDSVDPLIDLFDTNYGIFYGQYVKLAIAQFHHGMIDDRDLQILYGANIPHRLRRGMTLNQSQLAQVRRALDIGYSCAKRVCPEVLHDSISHPYVEGDENDDSERTVHYGMGIGTSNNILGEPLYVGTLSSGTQSTLLWIYALALKMAWHYDWEEGWEDKPAILLIDEIENHLHPTWQRRVIPALLEHFPGLQIFATTHSPFMVAGLKAGQVHLLSRDANGVVTASTNERDVIGWTADEILRTMMGVDEPTDQLTVDRANRLRQLREKETLTPDEETELNELRRQVNSDLLAKGGLLEAERERYADLVREFLRSQQSELTQDGG